MKKQRWNPYLVGALIGLLSVLTFSIADKPIGMSTGIAQASGACALPVLGADGVAANSYWAKKAVPQWDYSSLFVVGSLVGSFLSALTSSGFKIITVPEVWRRRFGPSVPKRMVAAFLGGVVILYGARLADGCTSGHGISGSLQLAVSSWTFFLVMFTSGIATAFVLFRRPHS
ncbi:MAG: hypothetical protein B9S36_06190 [Verrucomicrobiia bacterium Tous-C2TDCM]|nr:MAG: hypothetical protein B9S36_06190 [Verrucomicrobiae bacterium Tous-C2TDCM]